jgi:DNA-binding PadR family transcriptional regulator
LAMHAPWDRDWHRVGGPGQWARGRGPGGDAWAGVLSDWWRGPTPRAERGTVRWLVLDAIAAQPRHGYEIIQAIGEKSRGSYRPSPGVVYPTLQMLEELGHARTAARDERKVYEITAAGRDELLAHAEEVTEFYEGQADSTPWENHAEDLAHVMKRVGRVVRLFKKSLHRGGLPPTTMRKARKVLDDALEKLEELLTQEDV